MKVSLKRISLALIPILMLASCASWSARKGTAQTKYFAALTDYNTAKEAALIAIGNQSVPLSVAESIVDVMRQGDNQILLIEDMRVRGVFDGDAAEVALKILLELQLQLIRLATVAAATTSADYVPSCFPDSEVCFV